MESDRSLKKIGRLCQKEETENDGNKKPHQTYKHEYVWRNIIFMLYAHVTGVYSLFDMIIRCQWGLLFYEVILGYMSGVGITGGAHRLWTHKSYKAKLPLRILLCIFQTIAFQNHIYEWSRDHRVHHKFSETDADPHNAKRGFFFSHVGWLLVKKHPDVKEKGKTVDMSDLKKDSVVVWQRRLYPVLMPILAFIIPTLIPIYCWGCNPWDAWNGTMFRWVSSVNFTWTVNSLAHLWGSKPYDRNINPAENPWVILITPGEGFHNYHHVFPFDYKASEFKHPLFNVTTHVIDFFAKIGWAYDLKVVPQESISRRILKTGDGSHKNYNRVEEKVDDNSNHLWGWGDKDMGENDYKIVQVIKGRQ